MITMRLLLWSLLVAAAGGLAWGVGWIGSFQAWLAGLARQPGVREAFADPEYGRIDALTLLLSFFLLTPIGALVLAIVMVFVLIAVALLFEPALRTLKVPDWVAVPVVLAGSGCVAWAASGLWLPQSLQILGLVVRAWSVYFSGTPAPK